LKIDSRVWLWKELLASSDAADAKIDQVLAVVDFLGDETNRFETTNNLKKHGIKNYVQNTFDSTKIRMEVQKSDEP